jgi:uncharacterized protein (TIGR02145 family)
MKNLKITLLIFFLIGCGKSDTIKIDQIQTLPQAPTELSGSIVSPDNINLTWKDNSTNETGYKIERKTDSIKFTEIGSTTQDVTTFSDKTISINTNYTYRVYSFNQVGKSLQYSNEYNIKTFIAPVLTTSPVSFITLISASSGGYISSEGWSAVTSRGVVWGTSTNPTILSSPKTIDGSGKGIYESKLNELLPSTQYYVRAYATNNAGTGYGNEISFNTNTPPTLTTLPITAITSSSAKSGGDLSSEGTFAVDYKGVVWGTTTNPTILLTTKTIDASGKGIYQSNIIGLAAATKYYLRAYASNAAGVFYGNEFSFNTTNFNFNTVVGANGRIWMDRNLGASQVATGSRDVSSYGDLYQWGRGTDGHQSRDSKITNILSSTDVPGNTYFIYSASSPNDWRSSSNDNLWQGVNGINNPCPSGYRLPLEAEWEAERKSWISNDASGAFASSLKLPMTGFRRFSDGAYFIENIGTGAFYWTSSTSGTRSSFLRFDVNSANMNIDVRAYGGCIRCIKN